MKESDWREPTANEKGHPWTWSESRDEPGVLLFRVCAVDGVPGHDLYLKATERDIEKMMATFDLRRRLQ